MQNKTDRFNLNVSAADSDLLHAKAWALGRPVGTLLVEAARRAGLSEHDGELLARYHAAGSPRDQRGVRMGAARGR